MIKMPRLYNFLFTSFIFLLLFPLIQVSAESVEPTLAETLSEMSARSASKITAPKKKVMAEAQKKLSLIDFESKALGVGEKFPNAKLLNHQGKEIEIKTVSSRKKLVVVFYRGEWCPYCNAHLQHLQKYLPELKAAGAEVVAISPDKPEFALGTKEKHKLGLSVLSDIGNKLAKQLGIVFPLGEDLKSVYKEFGIDLQKNHGTGSWELPLAAAYVLSNDLEVKWRFLDIDYKKRAAKLDIIKALKSF